MKPGWRRLAVWGPLVVLVLAGLAFAFRPQPVQVDTGQVTQGTLLVTVDDEGETRVRDIFVVSAPLDGRVLRIEIEVGDKVMAGETILATIEPKDPSFLDVRSRAQAVAEARAAEAALSLADAEVTRAEAELRFAESDLSRAVELAAHDDISKKALERAELLLQTREAEFNMARANQRRRLFELEMARARLIEPAAPDIVTDPGSSCCVYVRAPVNGQVLQVHHESEGVVTAGAPLIELGDPRDLEIVVDLLSTDAVRVEEGAEVFIEDWGGDGALAAFVRRVEPYGFTKVSSLGIEEQRVNVIIDIAEPPERWRALGHGYRVETRIVTWEGRDVLRVPMSALFRDGDAWAVFVESAGRAAIRHVVIGRSTARIAEVLDGLVEGDVVVLHPSDRIADGVRITARTGALR
ncbi:MAG: efflux RND transporter periplasmic adaptor subunit [Alphaproteobacteria bacterium]